MLGGLFSRLGRWKDAVALGLGHSCGRDSVVNLEELSVFLYKDLISTSAFADLVLRLDQCKRKSTYITIWLGG